MSYNFKKIIDLDLVEEVPEGANVLIETDGATKRLPSTAIKPAPIQPDMAQNDPTAPDYVKNRTHYEETAEKTVEGTGEFILEGFSTFEVGDTVTIKVDGVEYSLVAFLDDGYVTIGDVCTDVDSGTGEFGWNVYISDSAEVIFYSKNNNRKVSFLTNIIHKLDMKYLPDGVGGGGMFVIETTSEDGLTYIPSVSYNEAMTAFLSGKSLYLHVNIWGGELIPLHCERDTDFVWTLLSFNEDTLTVIAISFVWEGFQSTIYRSGVQGQLQPVMGPS